MIGSMLFHGWAPLLRTLLVGTLAYVSLVLLQRISGKRTLSKMNAFDLIVTVALGSTLATVLLSKDVSLADGVLAVSLLMGLQFVVTWLSVHWRAVGEVVKAEPTLLFYQGRFLDDAMREQRVVRSEVLQAARSAGVHSLNQVEAVVLETDGGFSVVKGPDDGSGCSTLQDVTNLPEQRKGGCQD